MYGSFDGPGGHAEVNFENVRVPAENLLVGEGQGKFDEICESFNPSVPDSVICVGAKLAHFGLREEVARD